MAYSRVFGYDRVTTFQWNFLGTTKARVFPGSSEQIRFGRQTFSGSHLTLFTPRRQAGGEVVYATLPISSTPSLRGRAGSQTGRP